MNKKRLLILFTFIFSLFFLNQNVKAYNIVTLNNVTYNEDVVYNEFLKLDGYEINNYSKISCTYDNYALLCYSFDKNTTVSYSSTMGMLQMINDSEDCSYYYLYFYKYNSANNKQEKRSCSYNNSYLTIYTSNFYSNFNVENVSDEDNAKYNVLDFSSYMSDYVEKEEMEILDKSSNLLTTMLDKSLDIYNTLINNQIFSLCIGVLLSYLIFMVVYKIMKR